MTQAVKAESQQSSAKGELALGQQAADAKRAVEAREHFNAVVNNQYADPQSRKLAGDALAADTNTINDAHPANLLKVEDVKPADAAAPATPVAATPAPAATAPTPANTVVPPIEPAPAPTAATPAPAADAPAPAPAAEAPAMSGSQYYHLAQQQYRKGDWIAARQNFEASRNANYHPGLFDGESPAQYLARMDKKESADRAETERRMARAKELETAHAQQVATIKEADSASAAPKPIEVAVAPTPDAVKPEAPAPAPATPAPAVVVAPTTAPSTPEVTVVPAAPAPTVLTADDSALADLRATQRAEEVRHQQNAYEAVRITKDASDAQRQGDLETARQLYTRAVNLDPDNAQARAGLNEVLIQQGRNPRTSNVLDEQQQANLVRIRAKLIPV